MLKIQASVTINRPIQEVFAFASDPNNYTKWQTGVLESTATSPGPLGVGTTSRDTRVFLGRRMEQVNEITAYEPPTKYAFKIAAGAFPASGALTFEAVNGSTRVTEILEAEPGGFFKIAEPLISSIGKRQVEGDLHTLKDLLEAHAEKTV